jgi:hypothetical protein
MGSLINYAKLQTCPTSTPASDHVRVAYSVITYAKSPDFGGRPIDLPASHLDALPTNPFWYPQIHGLKKYMCTVYGPI